MKALMINDCVFVGEMLSKHLPSTAENLHIRRARNMNDRNLWFNAETVGFNEKWQKFAFSFLPEMKKKIYQNV